MKLSGAPGKRAYDRGAGEKKKNRRLGTMGVASSVTKLNASQAEVLGSSKLLTCTHWMARGSGEIASPAV